MPDNIPAPVVSEELQTAQERVRATIAEIERDSLPGKRGFFEVAHIRCLLRAIETLQVDAERYRYIKAAEYSLEYKPGDGRTSLPQWTMGIVSTPHREYPNLDSLVDYMRSSRPIAPSDSTGDET